jgi:hypothetical protein
VGLLYKGEASQAYLGNGPSIASEAEGESTVVCYGYRSDEIEQLSRTELGAGDVKINLKRIEPTSDRPPVGVSLGCHVSNYTTPHADPSCAFTLADGGKVRMGKRMPTVRNRPKVLKQLSKDTEQLITRELNLQPLPIETMFFTQEAFLEWLPTTNYPQWRMDELIEIWEHLESVFGRDDHGRLLNFNVKLFMKDEHYIDYKHARGIYARDDVAKCIFGPIFKAIEQQVYKSKFFIKHVPVKDRPTFMFERLYSDGATYIQTDFSSFEAHFSREMMHHNEFVLYKHMLQYLPQFHEIMDLFDEVLAGRNCVQNKFLTMLIEARRMSGEMNTSLGNGFSNLALMYHVVCNKRRENNCDVPFVGVVEGDDGLFAFNGICPTTEDFTSLGCIIKLEPFRELSVAGFCGNIFDETDLQVVTDPFKVCANFGWTTFRYLNASKQTKLKLLRCKALSMAHQYPGCPIIGALAQYGLRVTRSFDVKDFVVKRRDIDMYHRQQLLAACSDNQTRLRVEPGMGTRLLFEELFGITVEEQIYTEKYLDNLERLQPLELPFMELAPDSWADYHDKYQFTIQKEERAMGGTIVVDVGRFTRTLKPTLS